MKAAKLIQDLQEDPRAEVVVSLGRNLEADIDGPLGMNDKGELVIRLTQKANR